MQAAQPRYVISIGVEIIYVFFTKIKKMLEEKSYYNFQHLCYAELEKVLVSDEIKYKYSPLYFNDILICTNDLNDLMI